MDSHENTRDFRVGWFKALSPATTDWIRWGAPLTVAEQHFPEPFASSTIVSAVRQLRDGDYDLIVLPAIQPNHKSDQPWGKLIAKKTLEASSRGQVFAQLLRRFVVRSTRHIIVDIGDERDFCRPTISLFQAMRFISNANWISISRPIRKHRTGSAGCRCSRQTNITVPRCIRISTSFSPARSAAEREFKLVKRPGPIRPRISRRDSRRPPALPRVHGDGSAVLACAFAGGPRLGLLPPLRGLFVWLGSGNQQAKLSSPPLSQGRETLLLLRCRSRFPSRPAEHPSCRQGPMRQMATEGRTHILANHTRAAVARYMLSELRLEALETGLSQDSEFTSEVLIPNHGVRTLGQGSAPRRAASWPLKEHAPTSSASPVSTITMDDAIGTIERWIEQRTPNYVFMTGGWSCVDE